MCLPYCCAFVLFSSTFLLLLPLNKHWLFNSKGCSINIIWTKSCLFHSLLNFLEKNNIWCPGWIHMLRLSSEKKMMENVYKLLSSVAQFLPCKNRSVQFDLFWYCVKRNTNNEFLHLVFNWTLRWVSITWIQVHLRYLP